MAEPLTNLKDIDLDVDLPAGHTEDEYMASIRQWMPNVEHFNVNPYPDPYDDTFDDFQYEVFPMFHGHHYDRYNDDHFDIY